MDGFEEMFAANHLGPFLLTNLLVELLQSAVQVSGSAAPLRLFIWIVSSQAQEIAENVLQVVMSPESKKTTGKFLYGGKEIEAHAYAYDRAAQQRLWEMSEALTDLAVIKGELPVNDPHLQ